MGYGSVRACFALRNFCAQHAVLLAITFVATALRLYSLNHGVSYHPDERHIVMVTENLSWADPNPHSFAYGSLPFYISWVVSESLGFVWPQATRYDGLFLVGRCIAAMFGVLGVLITYALTQSLFANRTASLFAAAFMSLNVFHLQLSRFFAVDIFLTTFCLITLYFSVRLARSETWQNYALAAISFGLALATKISAVTLLAPLGIAVLIQARRNSRFLRPKTLGYASLALLISLVVCIIAQPYAVLDFETFLKHTLEQTNMVRGLWRPPYTIQYSGTLPYLYPLTQMWSYTMGPPLAFLSLAALTFVGIRQFKCIRPGELVVLAWIISVFIAFGGLNVKFPRYFLPIYPALFALAAYALVEFQTYIARAWSRRLRLVPSIIILGWSALYCLAFVRIYSVDHSYQLATRWIFQNIPPGSALLGVDWDDKLPVHLPGLDPRHYRYEGRPWELPLYANESQEKLVEISEKLSRGDYLIFPTNRTYGSIPRIPHEYVFTTNFLRLLFAGKLGYELKQTIKATPSIAGIEFDDDEADESFSVYDHPKISIFQKIEKLPGSEYQRRILEAYRFAPLPELSDMLQAEAGADGLPPSSVRPSLGPVLVWLLGIYILGAAVLPLVACVLPRAPDRGYGIAKPLGLVLVGYIVWLLTSLGLLVADSVSTWLIVLVLLLISSVLRWKLKIPFLPKTSEARRAAKVGELLFLVGFFLFAFVRAMRPEIFWGEKPMDFGFLNYFIRLETLPPQDPWASGQVMHYYYFGTFLFALLHKLTAVDSALGYNLAIATVAGFALSSSYSFCLYLTKRIWPAVFGALAVILLSNLEVVRLVFWGTKRGFDLFWASSRLLKEPAITEYPIWALLFADLHAHVIALSIVLVFLTLLLRFLHAEPIALGTSLVLHRLICGALLGCLFITNTWDFISYGVVLGCFMCYGAGLLLWERRSTILRRFAGVASDLLRDTPLLILGAAPVIALFIRTSGSQTSPGFGFNQSFEFNSVDQILRHLGLWIAILVVAFPTLSINRSIFARQQRIRSATRLFIAALIGSIPVAIALLTALRPFGRPAPALQQLPWSIVALCSLLCFIAGFAGAARSATRRLRVASLMTIVAGVIIAGSEICFLIDHMNTIFKFYNAVWILLGLAAVLIFPPTVMALWRSRRPLLQWGIGRPLCLVLTALLAVGAAGSVFNIFTMTTFRRVNGPSLTLDGMAYLNYADPHEAGAINWLRNNVQGTPTILEAHGHSYGPFTRISMHTGLPTVLGWEWHIQQRGTPIRMVKERMQAIKAVYSSPDPETAVEWLKLLGVDFVYLGPLERQLYTGGTYDRAGLRKWDEHYDLFIPVYRSGASVVYKMAFSTLR